MLSYNVFPKLQFISSIAKSNIDNSYNEKVRKSHLINVIFKS